MVIIATGGTIYQVMEIDNFQIKIVELELLGSIHNPTPWTVDISLLEKANKQNRRTK